VCVCVCVCILALVIWHENHIFLRCIILSSVAIQVPPHISTLPHKWHDFRENTELEMCVLILSTTSVSNTSRSNKNNAKYYHKRT